MTDEITLTHKHLLGLELLYCQPHKWTAGDRQVADDLKAFGLMQEQMHPGSHPLTHKGSKKCAELIAEGKWPPSLRGTP